MSLLFGRLLDFQGLGVQGVSHAALSSTNPLLHLVQLIVLKSAWACVEQAPGSWLIPTNQMPTVVFSSLETNRWISYLTN